MQSLRRFGTIVLAAATLSTAGLSLGQTEQQGDAKSSDQHMQRMQDQMRRMHEQMELMRKTSDPKERERIMQEHMRTMHEHIQDMHAMAGSAHMGGMMDDCMAMMSGRDGHGEDSEQGQDTR